MLERFRESIQKGRDLSGEIYMRGRERFISGAKIAGEIAVNTGVYAVGGAVTGYLMSYFIYPYYAIGHVGEAIVRQSSLVLAPLSEVHESGLLMATGMGVVMGGMGLWQYCRKSKFPNDSFRFS